jgi:hypothetical protein
MSQRFIGLVLIGLLGLSGCSLPAIQTQTPPGLPAVSETPFQPAIVTPLPELVTATPAPTSTSTVIPPLTIEQLRNGEYFSNGIDGSPTPYRLTDGSYRTGSDPAAIGYAAISLLAPYAIGNLDDDPLADAAVILVENYGGTGQFVQVGAVLNLGGQPTHVANFFLGDRVLVNAVSIQNYEINLDLVVHGPQDGQCCPTVPATMRLRLLNNNRLMVTRFTTLTPGGQERAINIRAPLNGAEVSGSITITGDVPIAPFENNLTYTIYDSEYREITRSWLMVDAPDMGAPGTFALSLDLASLGVRGDIYVEITDFSAADGSVLALAQVHLKVR